MKADNPDEAIYEFPDEELGDAVNLATLMSSLVECADEYNKTYEDRQERLESTFGNLAAQMNRAGVWVDREEARPKILAP